MSKITVSLDSIMFSRDQSLSESQQQLQQVIGQLHNRQLNSERTKLAIIILLVLLLAAVSMIILQRRKQHFEILALKSGLDSYMIANVLLNIIGLIRNTSDKEAAANYLIDFRRLLRNVLDFREKDEIKLEQELATIGYYLSLSKLRLQPNLTYEIEVDEELDTERLKIPSLVLHSFVENAVMHGIKNKKRRAKLP